MAKKGDNIPLELRKFKPVHILPFRLNDISMFINNDHPNNLHPDTAEYDEYWDRQTERSICGFWGDDYSKETKEGGWRWMPGMLYFYINMCKIKLEEDGKEISAPPKLRDIDWLIFYAVTACDGFSGFESDKEFTCFKPVKILEDGDELKGIEKHLLKRYDEHLRRPDGSYKKYVEPREYLYNTFESPMGKPMWFNEKTNLILLSSRRIGKSYAIGGVVTHDFTFNGSSTVQDYINGDTSTTTVVGSAKSDFSEEILDKVASNLENLRTSIGAYGDEWNGCYYQRTEGSLKLGNILTNKVKLEGKVGTTSTSSRIAHITYASDSSAGVGHAARRQIIEEAGLLGNFESVHAENKPTQERDTKMGLSIYIGTGGNIEKIKGIRDAFYRPAAYRALEFENIFSQRTGSIGLFIPAYYRKFIFKDENGNTDVEDAFRDEILDRAEVLKSSARAYEKHCISFPIVPEEMFMQSSGNKFPTEKIQNRITELEEGLWRKIRTTGELDWLNSTKTKAVFTPDMTPKKGLYRYGDEKKLKGKELEGRIVIYEQPPKKLPERTMHNPMYIVLYDPVKEEGGGSSNASAVVFKTWEVEDFNRVQFNIVAEWVGRYDKLEDNHEQALKLAAYYGCMCLPEVNVADIIRHARMTGRYEWLQPNPTLAMKGVVNQKKKYNVGVYIPPGAKPTIETYLAEVMRTVVDKRERVIGKKFEVEEFDMVGMCYSLRFLDEALIYNSEENFDYISAMLLLALWLREQTLRANDDEGDTEKSQEVADDLKNFITQATEKRDVSAFNY